jgi:hypothetical protein
VKISPFINSFTAELFGENQFSCAELISK